MKTISEEEAYDMYNDMLDEMIPIQNGMPYSRLLEAGDPIAYFTGFNDFMNSIYDE
jgi:hypothetical protein